jgi:hypothetical protein
VPCPCFFNGINRHRPDKSKSCHVMLVHHEQDL